ncbi:MAG: pyrimidine dimer DNA glycosylase/endonuclease V [Candidatus Micrarchaeota archaeon]|nr:pyrimidine dimer DNA glycosylase/endonuclease V [Candidatus Micrarchaeota archaeon]
MRLWSLHPKHLDSKGLVALWREGLLAQKVLAGKTKGYTKHPQLERFRAQKKPMDAIGVYLSEVKKEAEKRGYNFSGDKIVSAPKGNSKAKLKISVTSGQVAYEMKHLKRKLLVRDKEKHREISKKKSSVHPIFAVKKGKAENWEKKK